MQTAQEGEEECGFRGLVSLLRWFPWLNVMVDVFYVVLWTRVQFLTWELNPR